MWGSSFADLAKKAQELQEQASSISTGELFNLDAMQGMKPTPDAKATTQQNNDPSSPQASVPKKASFPLPSLGESAAQIATPKPQVAPAQKGKLKIVKKKSPKLGAVKLPTNKVPELSLSDATKAEPANEIQPKLPRTTSPPDMKGEDHQPCPQPSTKEKEEPEKSREFVAPTCESVAVTESSETEPDPSNRTGREKREQAASRKEAPAEPSSDALSAPDGSEQKNEVPQENGMHNELKDESINASPDEERAEPEPRKDEKKNQFLLPQPSETDVKKTTTEVATEITEKQAEEPTDSKKQEEKEQTEDAQKKGRKTEVKRVSSDEANKQSRGDVDDKIASPVQPKSSDEDAVVRGTVSQPKEGPRETTKAAENSKPIIAQETTRANSKPTVAPVSPSSAQVGLDSDRVMQQFTAQLQRLEANFEAERKEMQLQHQKNLEQALAAKDEEIGQVQVALKEKDVKIRDLKRTKEGNELRMDSLKREVQGVKELLQQRDDDIKKTKEAGKKEKDKLEQKIRSMELEQGKTKAELKSLKEELENSRGKLGETNDEYTNLKSRVKVVAGELKDRRAECRELKGKIEELEDQNSNLQHQISALDAQLSDRDRSGTEKDEEANNLRAEIEKLQRIVKEKEKNIEEQEGAHEKNLASYKKKAQNSLAVANARAAAAIQSKEEAELEARAARSTADATLERAKIAESNGQTAMAEAKEYHKEMEKARNEALRELETSRMELGTTRKSLAELKSKWDLLVTEKEGLGAENAKQARDIETERSKATNLQYELAEAQRRASSLQADVRELRGQLLKAESTVAADAKKPATIVASDTSSAPAVPTSSGDSTSKATIMMLQKQLQEANQTIEELKDALENAVEMNSKQTEVSGDRVAPKATENGGNGMTGAPLFYAMEKQAELNTARNEINRLASLYADVQSEKVEAQDALKVARRELDEERAKLQRYEKLASGGGSVNGNGKVNGHQHAGNDSGRTNIEYLKNIMMSFLNAKTLAERKALVPVIGAVLCLTPDEQAKAIQNIEATGGMEGFSTAFFESLGSRVGR